MSKITQVATYNATSSGWNTPIDIGAKASNVDYVNTSSGLTATTVQAAIDEALPKVKNVTVSATASSGTVGEMTYTHTQTVSWTGITANDQIDVFVTVGSFNDEIMVSSQTDQCIIYFGDNPSSLTTIKLVAHRLVA